MFKKRLLKDSMKGPVHVLYHVAIIVISATIALSLPYTMNFVAREFLMYWTVIGNEKIFLVSVEISFAVLLIVLFTSVGRNWKNRKLSQMAREAGLVFVSSARGFLARRKSRLTKETQGIARDLMLIGSTGFRSFADEKGDLHRVIKHCRQAKILLLNPFSEGASIRARSILSPDLTLDHFREQTEKSISFLKQLKAIQRDVRLKLYDDVPLFKMAISGDYIWIRHYHAGFDVESMPEFVFRHNQNPGNLYAAFYQYFLKCWNDPRTPEYDLATDELVYSDQIGHHERRAKFGAADS